MRWSLSSARFRPVIRRASIGAAATVLVAGLAGAQTTPDPSGFPVPPPPPAVQADPATLTMAVLQAAKAADGGRIRGVLASAADPVVRRLALFALVDSAPDMLSWNEADAARRELADWPRPSRRQTAAEKLLDRSSMSPQAVIAWFGRDAPLTAQGSMALAAALRADGQTETATRVIRAAWRGMAFDDVTQATMLYQFHDLLSRADLEAREDFLLYGAQGPASIALLPQLPADRQAVALARMALRRGDTSAESLVAALPAADQMGPGIAYERLLAAEGRGDTQAALSLITQLPAVLPNQAAAEKLWRHGALMTAALRTGDVRGAYAVAAHSGLSTGADAADAQFDAGWLAFSKLKDPKLAEEHFARLQAAGQSPLTQSRALYWRGRVADAQGDPLAAQLYYGQGAKFYTTFYGQLAATRGGSATLVLGRDPEVDADERARFASRDWVKAARLIWATGSRDAFKGFVAGLSESVPGAADEAMLVDLARELGDQELSMRVVRNAAKRGFILPERGYPIRTTTMVAGGAETPFVLGVTRQESSFDPLARSGAGARGMMQLMPATAQIVARRAGLGSGSLEDPDYNMRVGSTYLGQLVEQFSGSWVMAAAAYNAGPGRPTQWVGLCGDPRGGSSDPLDFIECIPFSETRDYVMRVLEAAQVYRARLNGGSAPITLAADLKRGSYGYSAHPAVGVSAAEAPAAR